MTAHKAVFIVCGMLRNEVKTIVERRQWPVHLHFLNPLLHNDYTKLYAALSDTLESCAPENRPIMVYGVCHPAIDRLLEKYNARRIPAQNCIEMLLGPERFRQELASGAFFLLNDWIDHWQEQSSQALGHHDEGIRSVLCSEHRYFLELITEDNHSNHETARRISRHVGLPLKSIRVRLEHFEQMLQRALDETIAVQERMWG